MTKRASVNKSLGDWFIDSGATDHISYEQEEFFSLKRSSPSIRLVLGDYTAVNAYGMFWIYLNSEVLLTRVVFVPDLGSCLLSVRAVTQLGCQVIFYHSGCTIWKDNIKIHSPSSPGYQFKVDLHHANISKATSNEHCNLEFHAILGKDKL